MIRAEVFISNSDGTVHFSAVAGESLLCSALNLSKQLDEAGQDNKIQNIQDGDGQSLPGRRRATTSDPLLENQRSTASDPSEQLDSFSISGVTFSEGGQERGIP